LIGLLAIAGLTACGDKVELGGPTTTAPSNVVRSVTVTPSSATLNSGDKITLAASVNADAGVTDRTVTWSTSNAAIANVDANGVVTAGTTPGTATITAASKADATVKGAALITVNSTSTGAPATVTISTINQTVCVVGGGCNSVPANLGNITGQIDVTLNVDAGGQKLAGVDLIMNCSGNGNSGADTVIATQNLTSASVASEAASAPVTLSFNTATFNGTTGAVAFRNGSCILKARARTTGGTTVASGSTALTLNNQDVVIGSITSTKSAINPNGGLLWNGGDVTVTATPVLFSGRTPASMAIIFEGKSQTVTGTGTKTATFTDGNGANAGGATDIDGITDPIATATFSLVDTNGQPLANPGTCGAANFCSSTSYLANPTAPAAIGTIRLDTQKPTAGTFPIASNADQLTGPNGYVSGTFRFAADSAAGYRGPNAVAGNQTQNVDNGGSDNVTVVFQTRVTGAAASTYTARTSTAALDETSATSGNTNSYQLRMITTDATGNADTTTVGTFGVDKSAPFIPTATPITGPANQATSQAVGGTGSYTIPISDNLSGPAPQQLVAQVINNGNVNASSTIAANNTIYTNTGAAGTSPAGSATAINTGCVIGRWNRTSGAANARPDALPVFDGTGAQIGTCSPTPYNLAANTIPANTSGQSAYVTTRVVAIDQAGNQATVLTSQVVEDATNPTVVNIDPPASVTGNSSQSFASRITDNLDVVGSFGSITYNTPSNNGGTPITLQYPTTSGPGVAFDNVLTTNANPATTTIPNFIINLQVNSGGAVTAPARGVAAGDASSLTITGQDEVDRRATNTYTFSPATSLTPGVGTTAASTFNTTTFIGGFGTTANNATVSNCPAAGCSTAGAPTTFIAATNPTTTILTATASGTSGTFTNPFAGGAVQFWYNTGGNVWFLAGNAAAGSASDTGNGTPGVGARTWSYSFTWDPPATTPNGVSITPAPGGTASVQVRAIGVNTNGDAIAAQPISIILTNP